MQPSQHIDLKEYAKSYHKLGYRIVPVWIRPDGEEKKPLTDWKQWQQQPQTEEEFEKLNWSQANGFAIICGTQLNDGSRSGVIDIDLPQLPSQFLKIIPRIEGTIRKRYHLLYTSSQPVPEKWAEDPTDKSRHIELKGTDHLCILYPSFGYTLENDNLPAHVYNLEIIFDKLANDLGFINRSRKRQPLNTILQTVTEGTRNNTIYDFATKQRDANIEYETTLTLAKILNNEKCKPALSDLEIEATVKSAYEHPLKTSDARSNKEQSKREVIQNEPKDLWPEIPTPEPYENSEKLTNDIIEWLTPQWIPPKPIYKRILAEIIKASYIKELFDVMPILVFGGASDSGKTRGATCIHQLAYKPIFAASFSEAALFRTIEKHGCTIIWDEADVLAANTPQAQAAIAILNAGISRDAKAWRDVYNQEYGEWEPYGFNVYGLKVLTTTKMNRETLERRSIRIPMQKRKIKIPWRINKETASKLRAKLMQYRKDMLTLVKVDKVDSYLEDIYSSANLHKKDDLEVIDGTLLQLFSPLLIASSNILQKTVKIVNSVKNETEIEIDIQPTISTVELYSFMLELQTQKAAKESTNFDAEVVRAIVSVHRDQGKFSVRDVTDLFNTGKEEAEHWKTTTIGHMITKLGFVATRLRSSGRGYLWDPILAKELCSRYDIDIIIADTPHEEVKTELSEFQQVDNSFVGSVEFQQKKKTFGLTETS